MNSLVITIDGPSGTGKSTVSKQVAIRSGLPHLDTGAFYRVATLAALRAGVELHEPGQVVEVLDDVQISYDDGVMLLDGEDVSTEIRGDRVTESVSLVSSHSEVRDLFVQGQRVWVAEHDSRAVVEGRDIGSVVFPDAELKIYLDARPEVRAQRRALQSGEDVQTVLEDIERRDRLDSTRAASPLRVPDGAVVVDTSDLTFEEVVAEIVGLARGLMS